MLDFYLFYFLLIYYFWLCHLTCTYLEPALVCDNIDVPFLRLYETTSGQMMVHSVKSLTYECILMYIQRNKLTQVMYHF